MYMGIQNNQRTLHSLQLYQVCYCNTLNICNICISTTTIVSPVFTTSPILGQLMITSVLLSDAGHYNNTLENTVVNTSLSISNIIELVVVGK